MLGPAGGFVVAGLPASVYQGRAMGLRYSIDHQGRRIPLTLRHSQRARRIALKVDERAGAIELVVPRGASVAEALEFARTEADWVTTKLNALPARVAFADGAVVPVRGRAHAIRHHDRLSGGVWADDGVLNVAGAPEHLARRVRDWFKAEARRVIDPLVHEKAAVLAKRPGRIGIRDQKTRWGSCSERGDLSFNWRIVMAPEPVLDYVVAHEVAHLVELNHSKAFWSLVERLTAHREQGRAWLRTNGNTLHRYG